MRGRDTGCTKAALHVFFPKSWLTGSGQSLPGAVHRASDVSVCGMSKTRGHHLSFHRAPSPHPTPGGSGSSLHAKTAVTGTPQPVSSSYPYPTAGQHQRGRALHIANIKRGFRLAEWIYPHDAASGGRSGGAAHVCTRVHTRRCA